MPDRLCGARERPCDEFFAAAVSVVEQAQRAAGNLAADVLADANNTYWTRSAWQGDEEIGRFVRSDPHRSTMGRIGEWCDEATFVKWSQPERALPEWDDAYDRLVAEGNVSDLPAASPENAGRTFPRPVTSP